MNDPHLDDHPASDPNELGPEAGFAQGSEMNSRRIPSDLQAEEHGVATWCRTFARPDAPPALRRAVLADAALSEPALSEPAPAGRLLSMFPLGGWGLASAALLLVALGTATLVELRDGGRQAGSPLDGLAASDGSALHEASPQAVRIVEDPSMALFHDVETFDEVGLVRGEVIADWGR